MISLADVREWLKGLGAIDAAWSIGRYEAGKERRCCVYQRPGYGPPPVAIGGRQTTQTLVKGVNVVVRWNANHRETEQAAQALYDVLALNACRGQALGGCTIAYADLALGEPADLGSDEDGIFGRSIALDIYYMQRQEEGQGNG